MSIKDWFKKEEGKFKEDLTYADRYKAFKESLDERQIKFLEELRGTPTSQVVMVLEKRIYDLEQKIK